MTDFEKLGVFYLGAEKGGGDAPLLYKSNHLTTHGMIVGMTGSGKTGLAIDLIEEAAIDGIPSVLIDPKGDLADILLQFPNLSPADFLPYIDAAEARRAGVSTEELATKTASQWRDGLATWGQGPDRIRLLGKSADFAVYTPGDVRGRPIQLLGTYNVPAGADEATLRDMVTNDVAGLLGLVGIAGDPVQSREHILLASIFYHEWKAGRNIDLPSIINFVITPPFAKIGVFPVESFYPAKDRMKLAMSLNGLVASPSFSAWREGEPLDIQSLLWTADGRPRVSVLSIAHLSDAERMFFVSAVLNAAIAWMRRQSGTGSLRALLYMDEIFGYFPPNGNPPSKRPMLTLLKQARAFGLGIVLSTQNPVDLDYKGLSNCGTWFVGRLQTERDKNRILDGLESVAAENGKGFDRAAMDKLVSGLGKRMFLMRDAADDAPVLFETRWALSYLAGPLTLSQIHALGASCAAVAGEGTPPAGMPSPFDVEAAGAMPSPFDLADAEAPAPAIAAAPEAAPEQPGVRYASVRLHFADAKSATDIWTSKTFRATVPADGEPDWFSAEIIDGPIPADAPAKGFVEPKSELRWKRELVSAAYQRCTLESFRDPELKLVSRPGESEADFRLRAAQARRERRDAAVAKLEGLYNLRIQRLDDKIRMADDRVTREKNMARQRLASTTIWGAIAALSIFGGRRNSLSGIGRIGSTARGASAYGKKRGDVAMAENNREVLIERRKELEAEFAQELERVRVEVAPSEIEIQTLAIRPRKADIVVETIK
ncbi:MAG: ATP-binding protein [Kiritimatiellae bacterium]|nr:ATP-binding protein [Kiritimatiellia bacterium]